MIASFNLRSVSRSPAAFDHEKLLWFNQHYLKNTPIEQLVPIFHAQLLAHGVSSVDNGPALDAVIALQIGRVKTLAEMAQRSLYFYQDSYAIDEDAVHEKCQPARVALKALYDEMMLLSGWESDLLNQTLRTVAKSQGLKLGQLAQPLRLAVTGGAISPSIAPTLALIGRERVLERLSALVA